MNATEFGNFAIGGAYLTIGTGLLFVAWTAWKKGGLMRLAHPLIWAGAAMFFFGCGGNMIELALHPLLGTPMDYYSLHHQTFTAMQFFGAPPLIIASRSIWKRLSALDLSRRR